MDVTESLKGHSTVISRQWLQDGGEHGTTSEFHDHGPITTLHLLLSDFFLIRSNAMWNAMRVEYIL